MSGSSLSTASGDTCPPGHLGQAGTSAGINLKPGSSDDGWIVPPPVKLADGTQLQLYKDGEALHAAYEAIERARWRVCLEVYIFADDDTGRRFAELLSRKARQGLKVFVLYDSFGSVASSRAMFKEMRRAGVQIRVFHPIRPWESSFAWKPFNRDHRKILFIDEQEAGLGGLNIGAEYAGSWVAPFDHDRHGPSPWRDNAVGLRGPSARLLLRAFAQTWRYVGTGGRIIKTQLVEGIDPPAGGGEVMGLLASSPTPCSKLVRILTGLIRSARRSIDLTMSYFAPGDDLIDELCDAAMRGVRVRLMLPAECDVHLLLVAARSFYERMLGAGIEVYERQGAVLHAKTLCVDEQVTLLGSTNLDYRSIEYNLEVSALIRSEAFGRQIGDLFRHDVRFARRIQPEEWRKRPTYDRLVQWAVNRARYIL